MLSANNKEFLRLGDAGNYKKKIKQSLAKQLAQLFPLLPFAS